MKDVYITQGLNLIVRAKFATISLFHGAGYSM